MQSYAISTIILEHLTFFIAMPIFIFYQPNCYTMTDYQPHYVSTIMIQNNAMTTKQEFKRIFLKNFRQNDLWNTWFLNEVCHEEYIHALKIHGSVASILLAQPYTTYFYGHDLPSSYISCVATKATEQGKGYMSRLITQTIEQAYTNGEIFAMLIPETQRLYSFYERLGFAGTFYVDEQRFTSVHKFVQPREYAQLEPTYAIFSELEDRCSDSCYIKHCKASFLHIMRDLEIEGGKIVATGNENGSKAMAFASVGEEVTVRAMLATDTTAANAALSILRAEIGQLPFAVWNTPRQYNRNLHAHGMIRIVNAEKILTVVAATHPQIDMAIRIHDAAATANNAVYELRDGECHTAPYDGYKKKLDLDVRIDVLAMVLFSAPCVASVFNLPGCRPRMYLMLD